VAGHSLTLANVRVSYGWQAVNAGPKSDTSAG
jgi:hypothetical protein